MRKNEVVIGGKYTAKVSGRLVTVRVDCIRTAPKYNPRKRDYSGEHTLYDVTNLTTGRKTTFRSAAKFRGVAIRTMADVNRDQAREMEQAIGPIPTGVQ